MASLCSGSNVACLAAKTLHIAVVGNATSCTKLFDVEVDPEKQKWLNMLFDGSHTCIFNKMEDMGSSKAYCCVHKKECEVPTGPDGPFLVPCGVSCKDVSKANPKNKEFRSGLQERKGVTAKFVVFLALLRAAPAPSVNLGERYRRVLERYLEQLRSV